MKTFITAIAVFASLFAATTTRAADLIGGQTNVLLDTATLATAANLNLSGVSGDVIAPGDLGAGSVAFPINARDAAAPQLPTTFSYATGTLAPFSGAIEHTGEVFFDTDDSDGTTSMDAIVGDFTIGFDAARTGTLGGLASGFFVESTTGIAAILFDIENPSALDATGDNLSITANLLVSPEFAGFLQTNNLATSDLSGADVGDALVAGIAVPEPTSLTLIGLSLLGLGYRRR